MINIKKVTFEFDVTLEKGMINAIFEITGLKQLDKEVLKWRCQEFDIIFEEKHRLEMQTTKFAMSKDVSELTKEIETYIEEKRKKIEKALEEADELRRFLSIISDAPEA